MTIIPFYGSERPELFAIERAAMDRPGRVLAALDAALPGRGRVLDVGAGDGFTARRLQTKQRRVVPLEPSRQMMDDDGQLAWSQGEAEHLPFADGSFEGAYATWAYFFSRGWCPQPGLDELHRVVKTGGPLVVVDNFGGDEFCARAPQDISADPEFWANRGFTCEVIDTVFEFDNLDAANTLMSFYFGHPGTYVETSYSYRVGVFSAPSSGAR